MLTKVLISCALLVAAQAGYAPSQYGMNRALIGGYAAQMQPAVTLTVLPSPVNSYGIAPSYGPSYGYGIQQGYAGQHGYHQGPISIPYYSSQVRSHHAGVDAESLQLANLALGLPSAGSPNPTNINIPQYHSTGYTAPAVQVSNGRYAGHANGASAAAAAANVANAVDSYKSDLSHSAY